MAQINSLPAFDAFDSQLRTLCLKEFPCGLGSWRSLEKKKKGQQLSKTSQIEDRFRITGRDYGAQHEKAETLEELVVAKTSPWNLDYSWSNEAKSLREIAVRSPWLIDERFVLSHFKTLRIVDKQVTDVDDNFLYFSNLEELTFTANYLRTVNSKHLPPKLKVLELCANQISNLADLCINPPPLIHLGLGYNKLHMIDDYITGAYWPTLLSLDLSFNSLNDLLDIIRKLQTLPKLRNLLLLGNPLALVPAYRGYTIDSLRKLEFLDAIPISADDKHKYKGLAKRKEFILDEAKMTFKVEFIRGVPMPEEMQNPEEQPEFPIVTRKYFVRFLFLEDSSSNQHELLDMVQEQQHQMTAAQSQEQLASDRRSLPSTRRNDEGRGDVNTAIESSKNVNFAQAVETMQDSTVAATTNPDVLSQLAQSTLPGDPAMMTSRDDDDAASQARAPSSVALPAPGEVGMELVAPDVPLAPADTTMMSWDDEIVLEWWQVYTRDDLLSMRDFFKKGMEMLVMEEKVLSYPAPTPEPSPASSPDGEKIAKGKKDDKKKESKTSNSKDKPSKKDSKGTMSNKSSSSAKSKGSSPDKSKDKDKKKKKGEPDVELQHMPAEYRTLASFHIPLRDFLENECEFETVFIEGGGMRSPSPPAPPSEANSKKDNKKDKKKGSAGKKGKDDAKGKKSPDKKGGKDAGKKGAPAGADAGDEEPPPPPPPLEVHVALRLHQWKTAMDSLKENESTASEPEAAPPIAAPTKK